MGIDIEDGSRIPTLTTVPDIRERLAKIETRLDHTATKEDVAKVGTTISDAQTSMIKWYVGTAVTLASLAFVAAKFIH